MKTERQDLSFYANRGEFNRKFATPSQRKAMEKRIENEIITQHRYQCDYERQSWTSKRHSCEYLRELQSKHPFSLISIRRGDGRADICRDRAILVICQLCCIRILQVYAT